MNVDYDFKMMSDIRDWISWLWLDKGYYKDSEVSILEISKIEWWIEYYYVSIKKDWVENYNKRFYI